jgi:hypothetical protein
MNDNEYEAYLMRIDYLATHTDAIDNTNQDDSDLS